MAQLVLREDVGMADPELDHPVKLFGPKWHGGPLAEDVEHVPVPVGEECASCGDPISPSQSGLFIWHAGLNLQGYQPWHRLCFLVPILRGHPLEVEEELAEASDLSQQQE